MGYSGFLNCISGAVAFFRSIPKSKKVMIVSHLDADGISAASILIRAMERDGRKHSLMIIPQIERKMIEELPDDCDLFFFTDTGSGNLSYIDTYLRHKKVIILDHHVHEKNVKLHENIFHVNPQLFNLSYEEISGAGVVYLFAKELDNENEDLAHLALVGAIGDMQENNGFQYLNNQILMNGIAKGLVQIKTGLNLFGMHSRPLHKLLAFSTAPKFPGIYGNEDAALAFLTNLGISPQKEARWRYFDDLTKDEKIRLESALLAFSSSENIKAPFGISYVLPHQKDPILGDLREFATVLNACGRLHKEEYGIGACLDDPILQKRAVELLFDYKKALTNALDWVKKNERNGKSIIKRENLVIINAKDHIAPTIAGTITSMLAKTNAFPEGTLITTLARVDDNFTKASLRIVGLNKTSSMHSILFDVIKKVGGEVGGHFSAAGALISQDKEDIFISELIEKIENKEEKILS